MVGHDLEIVPLSDPTKMKPGGTLRLKVHAVSSLTRHGIKFCEWQRDWDTAIWPHAKAGFFKAKQNIPRIFEQARHALR